MYARTHWDRSAMKDYAKTALKNYYWKGVLTTLIFLVLTGGEIISLDFKEQFHPEQLQVNGFAANSAFPWGLLTAIIGGIAVLGAILGIVYSLFVANPLTVGHNRYYLDSRFAPTSVGTLFHSFSNGYGNVVKTMFLKNLYIFAWSLLLFIPGIVKSYEYVMVPYLMAENPNLPSDRAFQLSKQMMDGRKMDLFLLDLSFIGWRILATITVIGNVFLQPYIEATHAEVYLWLRYDALHNGYAHPCELNGMFPQEL